MSQHEPGVSELFRRASDGLTPDVDRLVRGGIARGRSRQRRARIGTTVASVAVVGVVGSLAAVVLHLAPDAPAMGDSLATSPSSGAPVGRAYESEPRDLADFRATDLPEMIDTLLRTDRAQPLRASDLVVDEPDEKLVTYPVDGMYVSVRMSDKEGRPTLAACEKQAAELGNGFCWESPTGSLKQTWGPTRVDGVTCVGAMVHHYGYGVWATSCNAAQADGPVALAKRPPLNGGQVYKIAAVSRWFVSPE
jgi:hypothetical protein